MTTAPPVSAGIRPSFVGRGSANRRLQLLVRGAKLLLRLFEERVRLVLAEHAFRDELGGVEPADRRLRCDLRDHQRLRVRRLVLLVVPEAAVADEIDDDVVAELLPVGEREAHRRDRRFGVVRVHVDDRDVEALGEVARVARGAALVRVRGEADLVVRDQVERAAGRVAVEARQVERLRDDALTGERRVAVDQDRQRDRGVVDAGAARAVGLLGARPALDDRVDRLEMARVRRERDRHLARRGLARPGRGEVVLDVAGSALVVDDDRIDRPLALELAQDRLVRAADRVHEHVQPAAVCHPDHDLVGARVGGELDRLVEHRHHRVEALERELLLAEEGAAQVLLEPLGASERPEQANALLGCERLAVAARLDRLPQPHALGVIGEMLDLVGHRAAVDGAEVRQRLSQRLARHMHAQERGGNALLQLGRQRRDQARLVERRVAERLGAERIEARSEVPVHPMGLDECHRRCDTAEQGLVDDGRSRRLRGGRSWCRRGSCGHRSGMAVRTVVPCERLEQPEQAGMRCDEVAVAALEQLPPLGGNGVRILQVVLEQQPGVAGVQSVDVVRAHRQCCSSGSAARRVWWNGARRRGALVVPRQGRRERR